MTDIEAIPNGDSRELVNPLVTALAAPPDRATCPLREHLPFYGPRGRYCAACMTPLPLNRETP